MNQHFSGDGPIELQNGPPAGAGAGRMTMALSCTAQRAGRLSSFLRGELRLSDRLMNRLKWAGAVLVNGRPEHTDFPVQVGDTVTVLLDEPAPDYPAEHAPLSIRYEDAHFLAVDKPAGMLIHPSRNRVTGTLANRVWGYYQETGQHCAFHPVTRLDRDTFGIVLLAKHAHAHALAQAAPPKKRYHARTFGGPAEDSGRIDAPIARRPYPSLLREVRPDGKPSVTEFQVLERDAIGCRIALFPITGRTHQLRLHCAYMGFPIVGDPQYGSEASMRYSQAIGQHTQLLCAKALDFCHPFTGEMLHLESEMDV